MAVSAPAPIQHGEVPGIPSIGFDAIARTARDERGGDDIARNLALLKGALQLKAARPRFIATGHRSAPVQPLDKAQNRGTVGRERMQRRGPMAR